jgi:hypothetical protein
MEGVDDRLIFSATDLINDLGCPHLNIEVALGRADLEPRRSDTTELVAGRATSTSEATSIDSPRRAWGIVRIESAPGLEGKRQGAKRTVEAMKAGAEVIYQGVLFDRVRWHGYSDSLHSAGV